ncbi:MAG: hypothetical protein WCC90_05035, partial [Methylocella sp.]
MARTLTRGVKEMDDPVRMPLEGAHARRWRRPSTRSRPEAHRFLLLNASRTKRRPQAIRISITS